MSDFEMVRGFEEAWRPPGRPRRQTASALLDSAGGGARARLTRLVNRAPEVMVKINGRTRDAATLKAHLKYISRNGVLGLEDRDGGIFAGWSAVREISETWSEMALSDSRRRSNTRISISVVLSMPESTDPTKIRSAARAFARELFADHFDYVFVLHTDVKHPHVHIAVRALGDRGERVRPSKADIETWRQVFAQALRDRGVEAEATPRRARGVTRKSEKYPLRRIRELHEAGRGEPAKVHRAAYLEAARAAFGGETALTQWERQLLDRQARVRGLYLAQAKLLGRSPDPADRELGSKLEAFVRSMPPPDSQRLALARELRSANAMLDRHDDAGRVRER
jgi:type IV secretory pathway VirD2 relaxase